jgi:hypothetical protein
MRVKLINYNKTFSSKGKYRVIVDEVKIKILPDGTQIFNILLGNEIGTLDLIINPVTEIETLAKIYKSCGLSIPEDYLIELEDIENRLLYLIFKDDKLSNTFSLEELDFEVYPEQNNKELNPEQNIWNMNDDDLPF